MRVAVTGATGFLGRYIVNHLLNEGHDCRCWYRTGSDRGGFAEDARGQLEWVPGDLADPHSIELLVDGADAVVHAALARPGAGFHGGEGDLVDFVEKNITATIRLILAARREDAHRFVFISSCAVHDVILDDRPLDETHPLWPRSHYGAYKGAVEKFIHSFGLGEGYEICSLRPTGIYGLAHLIENSKWFDLVHMVAGGKPVDSDRGGKEVHAADVARAVSLLLRADGVAGQAYNCCDMYISDAMVAQIAKDLTGSDSPITGGNKGPKHQIETGKLRRLGMTFGGTTLLEETVRQMLQGREEV